MGEGESPKDEREALAAVKTEGEREQIKLQAAYFNGIAIGLFVVGGLTIPTSILLSGNGATIGAAIISILCFLASPALHFVAKRSLKELD
ncbi:amino acid transporter [Fulvimarina sp. MAC3]|uniref:amino acid transporter n=1 Tax=Fulvimarina sp. MAC3 TaxID=3148887 RepID=UPI0031FD3A66